MTSVQCGSAVAHSLFADVGAGGATFLRLTFGAAVALLIWRPGIRGRSWATLAPAATLGLVLACMNLVFYHAIARIPLGIAVTIEFIGPLAVAVIGSRRPIDLLWVLLAAAGVLALANGDTHHLDALGVAFAALAAVTWGIYIPVQARLGRAFRDGGGLALALAISFVLMIPDGLIEGGGKLASPHVLAVGLAVGVLSSVIPYSFELEALRRLSTRTFGVLMSLEPGVAAVIGWLILSQGLGLRGIVGIVLVSAASLGVALDRRERVVGKREAGELAAGERETGERETGELAAGERAAGERAAS